MMRGKLIFLFLLVFLLILLPQALASDHYTFEHANEMLHSGRINWLDYGPDAFNKAILENKPIFLLLTAPSWCYWCHVYTSDDYVYHPAVYPIINSSFVPIYVDADKRQDLTRHYLEGGWPSTTVFTPDRTRIFGFSGPRPLPNLIENLNNAIAFVDENSFASSFEWKYTKTKIRIPSVSELENTINLYVNYNLRSYDSLHGGFGSGQKFPRGRSLDFFLELYELTSNKQYLDIVKNTLKNQYTDINKLASDYNLFDPVEGAFHRYGTRRDWTPPHYEKMLYDNARLLKAYSHLLLLSPDDNLVSEVVNKTINYIDEYWYDEKEGGFFGNTDVHGEDAYYGRVIRSKNKPRVEKTKYTDWNSEAILTYLYLWENFQETKYEEITENSLDFYVENVLTDFGAYHYVLEDGSKGVRGNLLDNAFLLLALTEGYETLGTEEYLSSAVKLAEFSLYSLYDWNSGGFFERNSKDIELYAPGEHIILSKPEQENGVMVFAMLKLYKLTDNLLFLNAGIKTLGGKIDGIGGLDGGYYFIKSAQFTLDNGLVSEYNSFKKDLENIDEAMQSDFWLNELLDKQTASPSEITTFAISDKGLDKLDGPIFLLIFVAFFAGLISFASPCAIPLLPSYAAFMFNSTKHGLKSMSISFFLGLSLVFSLLGMSASFIGEFLSSNLMTLTQISGIGVMGLGLFVLFGGSFGGFRINTKRPASLLGAFLFGSAFALSWTPCTGPILLAILILASTTNSVFLGGFLLLFYAVGLALPLLALSLFLEKRGEGFITKIIRGKQYTFKLFKKEFHLHSSALFSGILFILLGYLMFSGKLFTLNQILGNTGFETWRLTLEQGVLKFLDWFKF